VDTRPNNRRVRPGPAGTCCRILYTVARNHFGSAGQPYSDCAGWGGVIRPDLDIPKELCCDEKNCAQFCAHPTSKTMANGSSREWDQISCTGAVIQYNSESSYVVLIAFGRSLNQRVGGSSPPRFTTCFNHLEQNRVAARWSAVAEIVAGGLPKDSQLLVDWHHSALSFPSNPGLLVASGQNKDIED